MPTYRVRKGKTFGASSQYKAGDIVELPAETGEAFADKLELVKEAENKKDEPEIIGDVPVIRKPRKKKSA